MSMRIAFRKLNGERHVLAITRADGSREQVECETRSYLLHDLLHYAVESAAGLERGFWGHVARGKTLAEMNDRAVPALPPDAAAELQDIERAVGALSALAKGAPAEQVLAGVQRYYPAVGVPTPPWLTAQLVAEVQERMRRLLGAWKATPYGGALELTWP